MATPLSPLLNKSAAPAAPAAIVNVWELQPDFAKSESIYAKIHAFTFSTRGLCYIAAVMVGIICFILFFPEALLFVKYLGNPCVEIWTNSGEHYYKCRHPLASSGQAHNPPPRLG